MNISSAHFLDTRRIRKDGTYPLNLRISYKGKKSIYKLCTATYEDYQAFVRGSNKLGAQKIKSMISDSLNRAEKIIAEMFNGFDKIEFEQKFFRESTSDKRNKSVEELFNVIIEQLQLENRIGTRDSYKNTISSLKKFHETRSKRELNFIDINKKWLLEYEMWLLGNKRTITTLGIYLRTLKAAYNYAIYECIIDKSSYPFGKREYRIKASKNIKKALSIDQIRLIFSYNPVDDRERFARDMFIFTYLCNGINFKDICLLKFSNIKEDIIMFIRSKTANSSISVSPIKAALLPEISEIIRLWGNKPALVSREEQYVFPFLDGTETAQQVKTRIGTVLKKINKYLKVISDKLELGLPNITTYYSRHSYATRLKNAGVSLQNISESLGHSNLATTKYYLDSIEDDQVVKQAKLLL